MGARPRLAPLALIADDARARRALRAYRLLSAAVTAPSVLGEADAVAYAVKILRRRV